MVDAVTAVRRVCHLPATDLGHDKNPLWLIAIALGVLCGVVALVLAFDPDPHRRQLNNGILYMITSRNFKLAKPMGRTNIHRLSDKYLTPKLQIGRPTI